MALNVTGGAFLTETLDIISQSLTIPVLIILLIIFVLAVIYLGSVIAEYGSRKKVPVEQIEQIIYDINNASSIENVNDIIVNSGLPKSDKQILSKIANSTTLTKKSREAIARKLVDYEEEKIDNKLEKTDIITRIGPTLGLMGTLIPLGPGLAALGSGDINTLASSLTVAFDTTVVGIGAGALAYCEGKVRRKWYDKHLSDLDSLSDAILDYLEQHSDYNG
ncbi:MAG: flagellar motor protein MotA [Methanosphaera sp. SHI1033]|nr:MAG: flagellar motor protein MotA [Methanosphaera sp. SHI1033]